MINNMKKIANNKTTLTGLFLAILIAVQPLTTVEGFDITKNWIQLVFAAATAIFGWLSQDAEIDLLVKKNKKLNDK